MSNAVLPGSGHHSSNGTAVYVWVIWPHGRGSVSNRGGLARSVVMHEPLSVLCGNGWLVRRAYFAVGSFEENRIAKLMRPIGVRAQFLVDAAKHLVIGEGA